MATGTAGSSFTSELNRLANGGTYPALTAYMAATAAANAFAGTLANATASVVATVLANASANATASSTTQLPLLPSSFGSDAANAQAMLAHTVLTKDLHALADDAPAVQVRARQCWRWQSLE